MRFLLAIPLTAFAWSCGSISCASAAREKSRERVSGAASLEKKGGAK